MESVVGPAAILVLVGLHGAERRAARSFARWAYSYGWPLLRFADAATLTSVPQTGETARASYCVLPDGVVLIRERDAWHPDGDGDEYAGRVDGAGVKLILEPSPGGVLVRAHGALAPAYLGALFLAVIASGLLSGARGAPAFSWPWVVLGSLVAWVYGVTFVLHQRRLKAVARELYEEVRAALAAA
jgi:catechol 2,3-dioxygenase-like lactoylglutathione lyase family enzyme